MFCCEPKNGFPCRKCPACVSRKVNEKFIIGIHAMAEYKKKGQFVTLTYDDDHLPYGLQHPDFAGFMKRLRRIDGTPGVKLFVAGEYGEKTGREHFHFLVYNYRFQIYDILCAWRKGFVYDGTLTDKSLKYVSGYVSKIGYDPELGKRPPYGRMSCNVPNGLTYDEICDISEKGFVEYNGRKYSVPRVWRKRYQEIWESFRTEREKAEEQRFIERKTKRLTPEYVRGLMEQRLLKYKARKYRTRNDRSL